MTQYQKCVADMLKKYLGFFWGVDFTDYNHKICCCFLSCQKLVNRWTSFGHDPDLKLMERFDNQIIRTGFHSLV